MELAALKTRLMVRHPALFSLLADIREVAPGDTGEAERRLLPALCEPDRIAVDVGANYGSYSYPMLSYSAGVIAVEPNPALARVLQYRFRHAVRAGHMRIECCALGATDDHAVLQIPLEAPALGCLVGSGHGLPGTIEHRDVAVRRLDAIVDRPVAVIKIDVEGYEQEVLQGALEVIRRDRPSLIVEAEERHRPGSPAAVRALLEAEGYAGYFLDDDRLIPASVFSPEQHQRRDALNERGTARRPGTTYINNFLFVARPDVITRVSALLAVD